MVKRYNLLFTDVELKGFFFLQGWRMQTCSRRKVPCTA